MTWYYRFCHPKKGARLKTILPPQLDKLFVQSFTDPENPVYGQIATVDVNGQPHVRTVHFRYLADKQLLAFNTYTRSRKWQHLSKQATFSACFLDAQHQRQWRWHGTVALLPFSKQLPQEQQQLIQKLWEMMRPQVRESYWMEQMGIKLTEAPPNQLDIKLPPELFGTVICHPTVWEIYDYVHDDYRRGQRTAYEQQGDKWQSQSLSLIG